MGAIGVVFSKNNVAEIGVNIHGVAVVLVVEKLSLFGPNLNGWWR